MRYIEIKEGLSIKKSEVESVEQLDNGGSRITMNSGQVFDTGFFYITLLQQLEADHVEGERAEVITKLGAVLDHASHFVG